MSRERKVGLGPMGSSQRSIAFGFAGLGARLGLMSAILLIFGAEPALLVALSLLFLMTLVVLILVFRNGVLRLDRIHARWAATCMGIGFAAGLAGVFGVLFAFQYTFELLIPAFIIVSTSLLTRSFLQMRQEWPRISAPTRRFVRNLLMVNVPTIAFLISYLFIVFPHANNLLALYLAYIVYVIPNGIVFAKRFKEIISSR